MYVLCMYYTAEKTIEDDRGRVQIWIQSLTYYETLRTEGVAKCGKYLQVNCLEDAR